MKLRVDSRSAKCCAIPFPAGRMASRCLLAFCGAAWLWFTPVCRGNQGAIEESRNWSVAVGEMRFGLVEVKVYDLSGNVLITLTIVYCGPSHFRVVRSAVVVAGTGLALCVLAAWMVGRLYVFRFTPDVKRKT